MRYLSHIRFWILLFIGIAFLVFNNIKTNRLNELALVSGISVDKAGEDYSVHVQVFNPAAFRKQGGDDIGGYIYSSSGKTISDAIERMARLIPHTLYLDSIQVVILGESLVRKEGLSNVLDYLVRDARTNANKQILISRGQSPDVVLKLYPSQEKLTSSKLLNMLKQMKENRWGTLAEMSAERSRSILDRETSDITIPYIELEGDMKEGLSKQNVEQFEAKLQVLLQGFAVFKKDKLVGWLTYDESTMLAFVKGKLEEMSLSAACPGSGYVTLSTVSNRSQIKPHVNPLSYTLNLELTGNVTTLTCPDGMTELQAFTALEAAMEKELIGKVEALIDKSIGLDSDFIGFKEGLYRRHPRVWKEGKEEWGSLFSKSTVDIHIHVKILKPGNIKIAG